MIEIRQTTWVAVIAAMTLAFNPIYFALSNTFMTDVRFTTLVIFTALFFARYLRTAADFDLVIATLIATVAILSRQLALAIPLAFVLTLVMRRGLNMPTVIRAIISFVIPLGALIGFQEWLAAVGRTPNLYYIQSERLIHALTHPADLIFAFPHNLYVGSIYLGCFLLPTLLLVGHTRFHAQKKAITIMFAVALSLLMLATTMIAFYVGKLPMMPMAGNIIVESGIGPITLRDSYILHLKHMSALPIFLWMTVTLLGALIIDWSTIAKPPQG